jgi:aminoglycoside phosphotransferase (APT) family kinase protein
VIRSLSTRRGSTAGVLDRCPTLEQFLVSRPGFSPSATFFTPLKVDDQAPLDVFSGVIASTRSRLDVILKVAHPDKDERENRTNLGREYLCLQHLWRRGFPSPEPLAVDSHHRWLLMTRLSGVPIVSLRAQDGSRHPGARRRLMRNIATVLTMIHADLPDQPEIDSSFLRPLSSSDRVMMLLANLETIAKVRRDEDAFAEMRTLLTELHGKAPRREKYSLTHGDFSPHNVLLAASGDIQVVDWGEAHFAPRENDVAFATSWACGLCENPDEIGLFLETYEEITGCRLQEMEFYRSLDCLDQAINAVSVGDSFHELICRARAEWKRNVDIC